MKFQRLRNLLLFTACSMACSTANAASITGSLWAVPDLVAQNAILANVPGTPADVTFQVNAPLTFLTAGVSTVNAWLLSGGAFNIVGTPTALNKQFSPSLVQFTGQVSVTNGQTFTVTHDDGLTLIIGGTSVISAAGPTGATQSIATYSGPTGNFPFTLVFGECCVGAAVLQVNLPFQPGSPTPGVPEPGTFALMAGGLAVAVVARRKRLVR